MTTQEKLVKRKLSIIELAEFLKNVSQACRINGVRRASWYPVAVFAVSGCVMALKLSKSA